MGQVFAGRYELVDLLGRGGSGDVWRVWDHRGQVYRAAKLLRQSDSAGLLRFVRESATRIDHPHVLAPTGWVGEDDHVLIAMPLVDGGSVADLVADHGPLPAPWVKELVRQLLAGLQAVHAAGVVHRDVKPANLLLDATGVGEPVLRLADFGIAVSRDDPRLTRVSDVLHTPGYAAPEVVEGADPDPRQDLFAAGVVMTELMTGRRPDPGSSPAPVAGELARVRARLVASDPLARYQSATEALAELDTVPVAAEAHDVEVFDHLPPLPDGWTAAGPGGGDDQVESAPEDGDEESVQTESREDVPEESQIASRDQSSGPVPAGGDRQRLLALVLAVAGAALLLIAFLVA